jgi:hypothetical protein
MPAAMDIAELPALQPAWQSPVEARWRRGVWITAASVALVMILTAAWSLWGHSSEAVLIEDAPPTAPSPPPVAWPPAEPEDVPQVAAAPVEAALPELPEEPSLPRRWLPAETRLVLSLRLADLAGHAISPEVLASGNSPLRQTLADLRTSFHLTPEEVRRITWAVTDASTDLRASAVMIELGQPLEDDAALLAGCERLQEQLAGAFCHQPRSGGWPHPFAVVDATTIVTGPLDLLAEIGDSVQTQQESGAFAEALAAASTGSSLTLVVDVRRWSAWEQVSWPEEIAGFATALESWPVLRDVPQAVTLELRAGAAAAADLHVVCDSGEAAERVGAALREVGPSAKDFAPTLGRSLDPARIAVEKNLVVWRTLLDGDEQLLTAGLVANLPTWVAPAPPAAADVAKTDAAMPPAAAPVEPATPDAAGSPTSFERHVARQFDERIASIALRGMKLADFSALMSRMTGIAIALDEEALAAAGLSGQTPLDVRLSSATLAEVLSTALSNHQMDFVIQRNRLLITTRTQAAAARQDREPNGTP